MTPTSQASQFTHPRNRTRNLTIKRPCKAVDIRITRIGHGLGELFPDSIQHLVAVAVGLVEEDVKLKAVVIPSLDRHISSYYALLFDRGFCSFRSCKCNWRKKVGM